MCLGIPGQIVARDAQGVDQLPTAQVAFGGVTRRVCVAFVPDANPGDFVLVHAGLALQRIDEQRAAELLEHLRTMESDEWAEVRRGSEP